MPNSITDEQRRTLIQMEKSSIVKALDSLKGDIDEVKLYMTGDIDSTFSNFSEKISSVVNRIDKLKTLLK